MFRLCSLISVLLSSCLGVLWLGIYRPLPLEGWDCPSLASIYQRAQRLDAQARAFKRFVVLREPIFQELAREQLCLRQACERLHDLAEECYPQWSVCFGILPGASVKEKIGRLILNNFRALVVEGIATADRERAVREEFASSAFRSWCLDAPHWTAGISDSSYEPRP